MLKRLYLCIKESVREFPKLVPVPIYCAVPVYCDAIQALMLALHRSPV